jgi:hypothetical protein
VVLEVLADLRQVQPALDADLGELVPGADAGQQQQLRRADRAGAEHHLPGRHDGLQRAVGGAVLDAGRHQPVGRVLEQQPLHVCVQEHHQVVARGHHRLEEGVEGRGPAAVPGGGLEQRGHPLGP